MTNLAMTCQNLHKWDENLLDSIISIINLEVIEGTKVPLLKIMKDGKLNIILTKRSGYSDSGTYNHNSSIPHIF